MTKMYSIQKTSDRVDVIRCKDCRHKGDKWNCPIAHLLSIAHMEFFDGMLINGPDFFCAYGEQKEG